MSKQEWIDLIVVIASILSPIVALATAVYAAKSSKAARIAADLSLKMYEEQIQEKENQKKQLFHVEYHKLLNSLYTIPEFVRNHQENNFIDVHYYRYELKEAYQSFDKVNIEVFQSEDIEFILHVKKNLKFRIDEIEEQKVEEYKQLLSLAGFVEELFRVLKQNNK
ncbi:hypothetical protein [Planococcus sp. YIM B11945]|uniref:hypothetical protein n=1 Tax=Planococcus sp. YIM B11945 TaxID=3435410 RepID=UPI003D7E7F9C